MLKNRTYSTIFYSSSHKLEVILKRKSQKNGFRSVIQEIDKKNLINKFGKKTQDLLNFVSDKIIQKKIFLKDPYQFKILKIYLNL